LSKSHGVVSVVEHRSQSEVPSDCCQGQHFIKADPGISDCEGQLRCPGQ